MKGAQRRLLRQHGDSIVLRNYARTESGGRESWNETTDSPYTLQALVDPTRRPRVSRDAYDAGEIDVLRSFHIESGTPAANEVRDGGGESASEIDYGGQTWYVIQIDDRDTGLAELVCERGT